MKKELLFISTVVILIVSCTNNTGPSIKLSTEKFNLGDIDPDKGVRTETFQVKNSGDEVLRITSISTSCGCTTAEVESKEIPPGDQTELRVSYDPSVHPGLVGKIKRIVYIKSNDPTKEEVELELTGNSLPSKVETSQSEFTDDHDEKGLLKDFEISPAALKNKLDAKESFKLLDVREDYEYEESHIKDTLLLSVNSINQEGLDKLGLKKDDEIIVYCRSGRRSADAYKILNAMGYTNVKSLYGGIVHWTEDGYPVEKGEAVKNLEDNVIQGTPIISIDKVEHDFGEIFQFGGIVNTTFKLTNKGDADLKISSISTSCACASAELEDLVVPPQESSILTVFFDPNFHEEPSGRFSRTVFLETNDPANSEPEIRIWVDILEGQ